MLLDNINKFIWYIRKLFINECTDAHLTLKHLKSNAS